MNSNSVKPRPLFEKILIANRGEIALRIMRTLKKLGIKSVAIYSEADTNSQHVQYADEAYYVGSSPATSSYLSIKNIFDAIRQSGAQAVHPGYGFLSENAHFATALRREGITLIGPNARTIKQMGDKIEAKKIAIESGVSTVPGYTGIITNVSSAIKIAQEIGFPVIIKAAAGGGGRGMRVVNNKEEVSRAYSSAKREAENTFNDSRLFVEKFITSPRHIEIQLIADQYENYVCLGERECSIQRYHQKIIEEAPSSFIDQTTREKIYAEVVNLAKKVGYYSAGTVEFMVDKNKNYYFVEMNTRLQVEHPVTEMITGIDIVEEMIKIAAGKKLSFTQKDIKFNGWSIESRIYAEDPSRNFLPSSGRVFSYKEPPRSQHIRIDQAIDEGDTISMFYDSMIAKLCSHGKDRKSAIEHMSKALSLFIIEGISHNISFLETIINNPRFIAGDINTGFIEEEFPDGFSRTKLTPETIEIFLAVSVLVHILEQKRSASITDQIDEQVTKIGTRWIVTIEDTQYPIIVKQVGENGYNIRSVNVKTINRIYMSSNWNLNSSLITTIINGKKTYTKIKYILTGYILTNSGISVKTYVRSPRISELESLMPPKEIISLQLELTSPITGKIVSIHVKEGDQVKEGQILVTISAMKMENMLLAEKESTISKILVSESEEVTIGTKLIEFL